MDKSYKKLIKKEKSLEKDTKKVLAKDEKRDALVEKGKKMKKKGCWWYPWCIFGILGLSACMFPMSELKLFEDVVDDVVDDIEKAETPPTNHWQNLNLDLTMNSWAAG